MMKAKEALTNSSNEIASAISWLEKDSAISGAKKASKVEGRQAKEGAIGVTIIVDGAPMSAPAIDQASSSLLPPLTMAAKAGIVELNCETDFVGRNEIFQALLLDLAHTVALYPTLAMSEESASTSESSESSQEIIDIPISTLLQFPMLSEDPSQKAARTVGDAILDVISRLGERISLTRASCLSNLSIPSASAPRRGEVGTPWLVASAFTHGGVSQQPVASSSTSSVAFSSTGRVASLLLTKVARPKSPNRRDEDSLKAMRGLARSLARQAAGMPTSQISGPANDELSLYNQPFIMKLKAANLPGQQEEQSEETVQKVLKQWGEAWLQGETQSKPVSVLQLRRWALGESAEIKVDESTQL
jgi:elongation factor Ts